MALSKFDNAIWHRDWFRQLSDSSAALWLVLNHHDFEGNTGILRLEYQQLDFLLAGRFDASASPRSLGYLAEQAGPERLQIEGDWCWLVQWTAQQKIAGSALGQLRDDNSASGAIGEAIGLLAHCPRLAIGWLRFYSESIYLEHPEVLRAQARLDTLAKAESDPRSTGGQPGVDRGSTGGRGVVDRGSTTGRPGVKRA